MKNPKFRIGDTVRISSAYPPYGPYPIGAEFIVTDVRPVGSLRIAIPADHSDHYYVGDAFGAGVWEKYLEKVEPGAQQMLHGGELRPIAEVLMQEASIGRFYDKNAAAILSPEGYTDGHGTHYDRWDLCHNLGRFADTMENAAAALSTLEPLEAFVCAECGTREAKTYVVTQTVKGDDIDPYRGLPLVR